MLYLLSLAAAFLIYLDYRKSRKIGRTIIFIVISLVVIFILWFVLKLSFAIFVVFIASALLGVLNVKKGKK